MDWTLERIHESFDERGFYDANNVSFDLESTSLLLTFHNFGELPIVIAVSDKQVLVEVALVERHEFDNPSEIDYLLLTTHKYLPLSTIAIQSINSVDWYVLFGALSTQSRIEVIIEELMQLVSNTFNVIDTLEPLYKFNAKAI
ncbi:DUF2170 family protein [Marinomonas posidonica]|uniref:Cytoplasmic protein n=1 Tax=Marinomonas posidonica (strain CECT 7376 / NCIMB 14433 / IVIA-Po-181) TaxID=491952 RepID=F6CWC3_MARPP|nr:DUF2170 family protein [Marinomonas posidonica]AEF53178.1 Protein of unknown function DUF2170 [Marinomonas posidonica IVIA-Po-181]